MRLIKMLGLAAVTAVAAMAIVGVSSALAINGNSTALCTVNELVCPGPSVYTGHIEGLAKDPTLLGKFVGITGTVLCNHSVILGNALGLAKPQTTHIESITFKECHLLAPFVNQACTVETKALGLIDLLKTEPNLGEATSLNSTVFIKCGSGNLLECTLGGEPKFHALGSASPTALGSLTSPAGGAVVGNIGGAHCPEAGSGRWHATYSIILPDPVYITL